MEFRSLTDRIKCNPGLYALNMIVINKSHDNGMLNINNLIKIIRSLNCVINSLIISSYEYNMYISIQFINFESENYSHKQLFEIQIDHASVI